MGSYGPGLAGGMVKHPELFHEGYTTASGGSWGISWRVLPYLQTTEPRVSHPSQVVEPLGFRIGRLGFGSILPALSLPDKAVLTASPPHLCMMRGRFPNEVHVKGIMNMVYFLVAQLVS
jgi:hypothetical protein